MIGILSTLISAGLIFFETGLMVNPAQPIQGEPLQVSYDSRVGGVSLANPQELSVIYFIQSKDTMVTNAEFMDQEGGVWTHSVQIPENAYFIRFKLEDRLGRTLDNEKMWYNLPVYTSKGTTPPNAHLSVGRGLVFSEKPDYEGARNEFNRELELFPWNWRAYKGLWDIKTQSAESKESVRDEIIEEVSDLLKSVSDSLPLLYETAILTYSELNEFSEARNLIVELLKRSSEKARLGRITYSFFLALASNPDDLIKTAENLLSVASSDAKETITYHYYFALNLCFRIKEAEEVLERFIRNYPNSEKMPAMAYRYIQASTRPNTMDHTKALEDYLQKYPESPYVGMASVFLARYYAHTDWKLAKKHYERAMTVDSSHFHPYNYFAYDCALRGVDLPEGERAILKAIDITDYNYYRERFSHLSFEERKEAMDRDLAALYDTYGWTKFKQAKYGEALTLIEKAVGLLGEENANSEILLHLAESYQKVNKLDEAVDVYMKLLQTNPKNEDLKEKTLQIFMELGGSKEEFDSILSLASHVPSERRSPAPEFTVKDMKDKEVKLSSLKGKVVVLNFWGTWCGPCRKEIPLLNGLVDSFKENSKVVFLAVSSEKKERIESFLRSNRFEYNLCYDGRMASMAYKAIYIPTHVIIDPEGRIYSKHIGFQPGIDETLEKEILEVLSELDE